MQRIDDNLVNLAHDILSLKGQSKQINFNEGADYQGELHLTWTGKTFQAFLTIFSDPRTYGGYYHCPPETVWKEQEDEFEAIKIKDIADWLKKGWGFDLCQSVKKKNNDKNSY